MAEKLKIAVLIGQNDLSAWAYYIIEKTGASNYLDVNLFVVQETQNTSRKNGLLWNLYLKIDGILFREHPNAFEKRDINDLIGDTNLKLKNPVKTTVDFINEIENLQLDVLITFSNIDSLKAIASLAKYGLWFFDNNEEGFNGIWEVIEAKDTTAVQLFAHTNERTVFIGKSYNSTRRESVFRNRNSYYWKAAELLPRKLKQLYQNGENWFLEKDSATELAQIEKKRHNRIGNALTIKKAPKILTYWYKERQRFKNYREQWNIFYHLNHQNLTSFDGSRFEPIKCPKDRLWADPFVFEKNGVYYLFIEELVYKEGLGKISVMQLHQNGTYTEPKTILQKDHHLSYPFLIEDEGTLFMIPESKGNNTIELYKCLSFPYEWKLEKILITDISAVDTTVLKYQNKYWLFCNTTENKGISSHDELSIFYSDSLKSSAWIPHPKNPVVSDVRSSRPAGAIFEENGKLWRPSQDSAKRYGHGIVFNEILLLDENNYHEVSRRTVYPDWNDEIHATHTINYQKGLTVIDGLKYLKK